MLKGERNSADKGGGEKIIIQNSEQLNRSFKSYNNLQYPGAGDDIGSQEQKLRIQRAGISCWIVSSTADALWGNPSMHYPLCEGKNIYENVKNSARV